jgi:hypothetical protein
LRCKLKRANCGQYHACRIDHDALIAAYRQYNEVCNPKEK